MAITEELFNEMKDKVTDLNAINGELYQSAQGFITDQAARLEQYGQRIFLSPKQVNWIRDLHEKYCGTAPAQPARQERGVDQQMRERSENPAHGFRRDDDDMDDEVPF
jgi:hypothetical protein